MNSRVLFGRCRACGDGRDGQRAAGRTAWRCRRPSSSGNRGIVKESRSEVDWRPYSGSGLEARSCATDTETRADRACCDARPVGGMRFPIRNGCQLVDSGVTGVSVLAASCPETPQTQECPDRPIPAHLTVTRANSGEVVASTDTNPDGNFRIPLAPGTYTVTPTNMSAAPMPSAYPISFEVREREFTTITVRFDSGIR